MDKQELIEKLKDLERFLEEECPFYAGALQEEARKYREKLEKLLKEDREAK